MSGRLNPSGDPKKTRLKLTWLPALGPSELTPLRLLDFDYLISKKKVEEEDDFEALVTPVTKFELEALGDVNVRSLPKGETIQLERRGYYVVDEPYTPETGRATLFAIPDGRARAAPVGKPVAQGPVREAVLRR